MTKQQIFPSILMVLDVAAGLVWYSQGNIRKAVYWMCAAVLTATVTF